MKSLEEIDRPLPIHDFMTQVMRTINPKKEFATPGGTGSSPGSGTPDGGGTPGSGGSPDASGPSPGGSSPDANTPPPPPPSSPGAPASSPAAPASSPAAPASSPAAPASSPTGKPELDLGPPQSKTDGTPEQRAQEAREKAEQARNPDNMKKWIAAGFLLAAIAAILAATLAHFLASDGAEIRLVTIKGDSDTPYVPTIFTGNPTQVACVWEVRKVGHPGGIKSSVRVTDKDELEWHDSTLAELDGKNDVKPTKIKGDHEFRVESGLSNSSDIDIKDQGWVKIHTSFENQLDQTVANVAEGAGDFLSNLLKGLTGLGIGTIVFIAVCVLVVMFILPLLVDLTKSNSSNK